SQQRGGSISLRRRVNIQPLITEPGTMEFDFGGVWSPSSLDFNLPTAFRITPEGPNILWGRSEFSTSFDSLASSHPNDHRVTQFSARMTVNRPTAVIDTEHFDMAAGPQASFFLHGDSGMRAGATVISRLDWGRNSAGFTANWSGATRPSDT